MLTIPGRGSRARLTAVIYGVVVFLWFSPEDHTIWLATLLGTGLSLLVLALWVMGHFGGRQITGRGLVIGASLWGFVAGGEAALCTAGLMFFKDARHAHIFPDYPPALVLALLERTPIWALAGGCIGLAFALGWLALSRPPLTQ